MNTIRLLRFKEFCKKVDYEDETLRMNATNSIRTLNGKECVLFGNKEITKEDFLALISIHLIPAQRVYEEFEFDFMYRKTACEPFGKASDSILDPVILRLRRSLSFIFAHGELAKMPKVPRWINEQINRLENEVTTSGKKRRA